jgi:hypothetical protein
MDLFRIGIRRGSSRNTSFFENANQERAEAGNAPSKIVGSVPKAFESTLPLTVVTSTTLGRKADKAESYWSRKIFFVSPLQIFVLSCLRFTGVCCDEGKLAFNPSAA